MLLEYWSNTNNREVDNREDTETNKLNQSKA